MFIAASCLNGLAGVVLLTALYMVLRPINRGVALFAAFSRLVYVAMWFVQVLGSFSALRIVDGEGSLRVFESKQLLALAGLQLASGWDAYYIGLAFYALSTLLFSWLFFQSRYIPRILATWGVLASLFEGVCAFAYLNNRGFGAVVSVNWYEMPTVFFELALCIWILATALRAVWKRNTTPATVSQIAAS
jgi:xanthine/uracil permease